MTVTATLLLAALAATTGAALGALAVLIRTRATGGVAATPAIPKGAGPDISAVKAAVEANERIARESIAASAKIAQALGTLICHTNERFAEYRLHVEAPDAAAAKAAHAATATAVATRSGAEQAIAAQVAAEDAAAREAAERSAAAERDFAEAHDFTDAYPGGDGTAPSA